jgi:hypothetical protein
MSHSSARICAAHKIVQQQCRCPEPITDVVEEECKHGAISERTLFWRDGKVVRGGYPLTPDQYAGYTDPMIINTSQGERLADLFTTKTQAEADIRSICEPIARQVIGDNFDSPYISWDAYPVWQGDLLTGLYVLEIRREDRSPDTIIQHTVDLPKEF